MDGDTVKPRSDGHLPNGRFGPGNKASLGNANNRKMSELRKTILESDLASPEAVKAVFSRLTRKALGDPKEGIPPDLEAIRVYLSYTLGRPPQSIELAGPDGEPIGIDLARVRGAILAALGDEPEARYKVARALLALEVGGAGDDTARDDGAGA